MICRLIGHKHKKKGYGNQYGYGIKSTCSRCGKISRTFEPRYYDAKLTTMYVPPEGDPVITEKSLTEVFNLYKKTYGDKNDL